MKLAFLFLGSMFLVCGVVAAYRPFIIGKHRFIHFLQTSSLTDLALAGMFGSIALALILMIIWCVINGEDYDGY